MSIEAKGQVGRLWWSADNLAEAQQWQRDFMAKGALAVELKPEDDWGVVDVIITLRVSTASEVVGYAVQLEEWLTE